MTVHLTGNAWSPDYWRGQGEILERDLVDLVRSWTDRLCELAQAAAPAGQGDAAGSLRDSIHPAVEAIAGGALGRVTVDAPQGAYTEFGTGLFSTFPGAPLRRITAQNGRALAIPTPDGVIFRRSIAGQRPHPWFYELLERFEPEIRASVFELALRHGFRPG